VKYEFTRVEDLEKYDCVMHLERGLNSILLYPELDQIIEDLSYARSTGHSWQSLACLCLNYLHDSLETGLLSQITSSSDFWYQVRWYIWQLMNNGLPDSERAGEPLMLLLSDLRGVKRDYWTGRAPRRIINYRPKEAEAEAAEELKTYRSMTVTRILEIRKEVWRGQTELMPFRIKIPPGWYGAKPRMVMMQRVVPEGNGNVIRMVKTLGGKQLFVGPKVDYWSRERLQSRPLEVNYYSKS
jgi:hypothetical protein